jgi:hypothetical protein
MGAGLESMEQRKHHKPDPFEAERVGHPKEPNQLLDIDVLVWLLRTMHSCTFVQAKNANGCAATSKPAKERPPGKANSFRRFATRVARWSSAEPVDFDFSTELGEYGDMLKA